MSEDTVQIDRLIVANFRVPDLLSGKLAEELLTISRAILFDPDYTPQRTLSVIATLEIKEKQPNLQPYSIAYLGISQDQNDPVVTPRSGKALGPFITYYQEMPGVEPLFQHQFGQNTVRIYPYTDTLLGVWARLLPSQK